MPWARTIRFVPESLPIALVSSLIGTFYVWVISGAVGLLDGLFSIVVAITFAPAAAFLYAFRIKGSVIHCPKCGAWLTSDMKFCYECGRRTNLPYWPDGPVMPVPPLNRPGS